MRLRPRETARIGKAPPFVPAIWSGNSPAATRIPAKKEIFGDSVPDGLHKMVAADVRRLHIKIFPRKFEPRYLGCYKRRRFLPMPLQSSVINQSRLAEIYRQRHVGRRDRTVFSRSKGARVEEFHVVQPGQRLCGNEFV